MADKTDTKVDTNVDTNVDATSSWHVFASRVKLSKQIDNMIIAKPNAISKRDLHMVTRSVVSEMKASYLHHVESLKVEDLSDAYLRTFARYTDGLPLKDYENALDLVPELVNLVSLADALPFDGSVLPFNLKKIAVRCKGAVYFAPRRFTAVQLPFDCPRSRVLLFHTGRVVGTGCNSAMAAKLAVARALKAIAEDAGVNVVVRRFSVINQVGAIALGARLDCDRFADEHSATAHFDPKSFVGMPWRPMSEAICAEIYSTGKANLPGSRRERQLLRSFARIAPELLRYSTKPELALRFSEKNRIVHRPHGMSRAPRVEQRAAAAAAVQAMQLNLWDDETVEHVAGKRKLVETNDDDEQAFGQFFDMF